MATSCSLVKLTNEIIAANNKILTKRSSNCSKTNCQMVFPREKKMREKYEYEEKNVVIMQCIQRRFQICYPNDDNE